jgi:sulfate transport system ATP-binding protein/putative spermidine/putrescine transport system ATP-binding protein
VSLVENLFYNYDDFKIQIPKMEIPDEGVTVLWGPSGSGKTTIFRILLGLISCPDLKWIFQNIDLAQLDVPEKKIGVVFQSLELFPHLTAKENILFAAKARRISKTQIQISLAEFISELDMKSFIDRPVSQLSGGEKQRVAIARALIGEPRFLFLDEPFSALDEALKDDARTLIKSVIAKRKIPTLLITHDRRDLDTIANKVHHLDKGLLK